MTKPGRLLLSGLLATLALTALTAAPTALVAAMPTIVEYALMT